MSSVQSLNRARAFHLKLNRFWKPVSFCHKSGPRLQEIHSLARSLTHSLTFFHPHINPPTRSHTAHPLSRSQTHSLTYSLTHSLTKYSLFFFFFSTNRLKGSFFKKKNHLALIVCSMEYSLRGGEWWNPRFAETPRSLLEIRARDSLVKSFETQKSKNKPWKNETLRLIINASETSRSWQNFPRPTFYEVPFATPSLISEGNIGDQTDLPKCSPAKW